MNVWQNTAVRHYFLLLSGFISRLLLDMNYYYLATCRPLSFFLSVSFSVSLSLFPLFFYGYKKLIKILIMIYVNKGENEKIYNNNRIIIMMKIIIMKDWDENNCN